MKSVSFKICSQCGSVNKEDVKFCEECGRKFVLEERDANPNETSIGVDEPKKRLINCPQCNELIEASNDYCNYCGFCLRKDSLNEDRETQTENDSADSQENQFSKCPFCGEILPSFVALCPSCGNEIKVKGLPDSVSCFIEEINRLEKEIAREKTITVGWKSWSLLKKIGWILLNLFTYCIPLAVYFALPLIKQNGTPALNTSEKEKSSLIKNYTFPNERDSIVNALLFIKAKASFLVAERASQKSSYWIRVWEKKAEHLYNKAQLLFPNDSVVETAYTGIKDDAKAIRTDVKKRALIGLLIVMIFIAIFFIPSAVNDIKEKQERNELYSTTFEWPTSGLSSYLPKPETNYGKIDTDDESRFSIDLYQVSREHFERYVNACKQKGFTINVTQTDSVYYSYNAKEYNLDLFYYEDKQEMSLYLDAPLPMTEIHWPTSDLVKQIPKPESTIGNVSVNNSGHFATYIDNVSSKQYDTYVNECMSAGFTVDYSRGDEVFHAYNEKGNYLVVEKHVFDQIYISIKVSEEE